MNIYILIFYTHIYIKYIYTRTKFKHAKTRHYLYHLAMTHRYVDAQIYFYCAYTYRSIYLSIHEKYYITFTRYLYSIHLVLTHLKSQKITNNKMLFLCCLHLYNDPNWSLYTLYYNVTLSLSCISADQQDISSKF